MIKIYAYLLGMQQLPKTSTLGKGTQYTPYNRCSKHTPCRKLDQRVIHFLLVQRFKLSFSFELSLSLISAARSDADLTTKILQYVADKHHTMFSFRNPPQQGAFIPSFLGLVGIECFNLHRSIAAVVRVASMSVPPRADSWI